MAVEEPQRRNAVDAEQLLDPEQRLVFERLRDWRNQRARQEGKPAYVLFTNHVVPATSHDDDAICQRSD